MISFMYRRHLPHLHVKNKENNELHQAKKNKKTVQEHSLQSLHFFCLQYTGMKFVTITARMWADAQRHGRPGKHKWRRLFHTTKFG